MSDASARSARRTLVLGATALCVGAAALAAPPVNALKGHAPESGTDAAIRGYDTVAYFTDARAVPGLDAHSTEWNGARWKFASAEHLALFKASPEKYAPQYGGYCAFGVAQDHLVGVEPDKFKIIDGKLYLNYNAKVQDAWLKDPDGFIRQADTKYPQLLKQ